MNRFESGFVPKEAIYSSEVIRELPKVGLVGFPSSGKEETARILQRDFGFESFTLSKVLHNYLNLGAEEEGEYDRGILLQTGISLKEKFGEPVMVDLSLRSMMINHDPEKPLSGFAFDGFRTLGETEYLKTLPNAVLIALTADSDLRFQRVIERARPGDMTVDTFPERDAIEQSFISPLLGMADYTYENSGNLEDLASFIHNTMYDRFGITPR